MSAALVNNKKKQYIFILHFCETLLVSLSIYKKDKLVYYLFHIIALIFEFDLMLPINLKEYCTQSAPLHCYF